MHLLIYEHKQRRLAGVLAVHRLVADSHTYDVLLCQQILFRLLLDLSQFYVLFPEGPFDHFSTSVV